MAKTDFLPFATGGGANVMSQSDYEVASILSGGFSAGLAKSDQANKVWRQASFMAATVANFVIGQTGQDQPDDGNLPYAVTNLYNAIAAVAAGVVPSDSIWCGISAGTPNSQTLTPAPPIGGYATGTKLYIWQVGPGLTNTGPLQINISGQGLKDVYKVGGGGAIPLTGGEAPAGAIMTARFNGTQLQLSATALGNVSTKNMGNTVNDPGTGALEVDLADQSLFGDVNGLRVTSHPLLVNAGRALATADNLKTLISTTAIALSLPVSTSLVDGYRVGLFARDGNITLSVDGSDSINGAPPGGSLVIPRGFIGYVASDANHHVSVEREPAVISYDQINSAATTDIGQLSGGIGTILGTGTIQSFGSSIQPGQSKMIRAGGAFTIVNNANIVVQAGQNYQCSPGDWLLIFCIAQGICAVNVFKADGTALVGAATLGNLANPGWTKLANGLIIQWGSVVFPNDVVNAGLLGPYSYPLPFPNAVFSLSLTTITPEPASGNTGYGNATMAIQKDNPPTLSQFKVFSNYFGTNTNAVRGFHWMAIGY